MGMREEFEAWLVRVDRSCASARNDAGGYNHYGTQACWEAWQASRAALVIELPVTPNRGVGYGLFDAAIERVKEVLESVGVSYK